MTDPQCITDDDERVALAPIIAGLVGIFCGPATAERWIDAIKKGAIVRRSTLQHMDVDLVALARYVRGKMAEMDAQEHALVAAMDQVLDDMGKKFSVCGATKAQARVALEPYLTVEEKAMHTPIEDALQILKEVGL